MLELYVPKLKELWFYQKLMVDPATMSYNANWDVAYNGYHRDTGCIDFPESEWAEWYADWVGQEPTRFYAYIRRKEDGAWIGDVNFHHTPDKDWWDMGIVIYAPYRGKGYATPALKLMLEHAFNVCRVSRIHNDFELARNEQSAWQAHFSAGFREVGRENGWLAVEITRDEWLRDQAVCRMTDAIANILRERRPTIYLYGSCVMDDFRPGWSDIDMLVLTQEPMSASEADALFCLRQQLQAKEAENPCFRSFEGGVLSVKGFLSGQPDTVVYWGTSGQRLAESFDFDCFSMAQLLENGVLLHGEDLRSRFPAPTYPELYDAVRRFAEALRVHGAQPSRSIYAFGWLLNAARCLYTLRTGKIIAKTAAGEWALANRLCPADDALQTAINIRRSPAAYGNDPAILNKAEQLAPAILRMADVLDAELAHCAPGESRYE